MTVGFKQDIAQYLAQSEIETRLLVVIEYDKDNIYRFIADESLESFEICGNTYLSTQIERGSRQENADNSIDSVSLTLSNHWQEWAAIVANHGNEFLENGVRFMNGFQSIQRMSQYLCIVVF